MPTETISLQFLNKLDTIQRELNNQGIRIERITVLQEAQATSLDKLATDVDRISAEMPMLRDVEKLQKQVNYHDRQLNEQTGRWYAFDHRKRTPPNGSRKTTTPPKAPPVSPLKELKDWGNIFRMVALTAVISAGVTAALATAGQMGWLGNGEAQVSAETQEERTKTLMKQIQELQRLYELMNTPAVEASLPDTTEVVYD
jgi:hypothetical protein